MYKLIKQFEGCKLKAYKCPAGIWTIGYGSTFYKNGTKVKENDTITLDEANELLDWYCKNQIKLPKGLFSINQKRALYSLIYNIGQYAFNSSRCCKAIESHNWEQAYVQWNWIRANGKVLNGLVKRRQAEKSLFFEGLL